MKPNIQETFAEFQKLNTQNGYWTPPEALFLFKAGIISRIDVQILSIVEFYQRNPAGCYISNSRLSKEIGINSRNTQNHIKNLKNMGLIQSAVTKKSDTGNRRFLKTDLQKAAKKLIKKDLDPLTSPPSNLRRKLTSPATPPLRRHRRKGPPENGQVLESRERAHTRLKEIRKDKYMSRACGGDSDLSSKSIGFFDTSESKEHVFVKKLHDALLKKNLLQKSKFNFKKWEKEFQKLIKDQIPHKRTSKVLKWYCDNIGGKFIPAAYSATSFVSKFFSIEQAMQREVGSSPERNADLEVMVPPGIQNHPVYELWSEIKSTYNWKGKDDELLVLMWRSYENAIKVHKWNDRFRRKKGSEQVEEFFRVAEARLFTGPKDFTWRWWKNVAERLERWKDFSGNLATFSFSHTSKDFIAKGRQLESEEFGKSSVFNSLIKYYALRASN